MALIKHEDLYTENNQRKTRSLFKETCASDDKPVASLSRHKQEGLVFIREAYIAFCVDDPTELEFAEAVFGDYSHWHAMKDASWIKPYLEEWRLICDAKRKSEAFKGIINEVKTGGRSAFTAAKFLIDEPWIDKRNKDAKKRSDASNRAARQDVDADVERMRDYLASNG